MSRLIALYPRIWRDRYEAEFRALMSERPPGAWARFDIVMGALDARIHPQVVSADPEGSDPRVRIGGALGVLSGALWVAASLAFHGAWFNADLGYKESGSAILLAIAAGLVTGFTSLTVTQALSGRHRLMWISVASMTLGTVAMALPWPILAIGFYLALIGILLFGLVGATAGLGPSGVLLGLTVLPALDFNTEDERALLLIPLGAAWIPFGFVLGIRGKPAAPNLDRLKAALQPPRTAI